MKPKVLIIEDTEADRKGVTIALKKEGYENVVSASDPQEGINEFKTFQPDIVIIDVVLPSQLELDDGIDVCKTIKGIDDGVKVIIITGHLEAVDAQKVRTCGADELLPKESGFDNLVKVINSLS